MLGEHPDQFIPGVETISGSLGHGLAVAVGMALADKLDQKGERKTYIILGDGDVLGRTELMDLNLFDLSTSIFGDHFSTGHDREVLELSDSKDRPSELKRFTPVPS